ncbi:MAG: NAD-dependent epimerase/dehydratase family protein [Proteobacteria bacterium]|nr:NAD-dependent epimerase/dehydratase family protein [Pseudomonadota bacterium]
MHCCVTGGSGFIGHHLVRILDGQGKTLTVIGRNRLPSRTLPSGVRYIAGDYGDHYFLRGVLNDVDEIIDLAYASVPKTSFEDPVKDILNNLPPSVNLFEVASSLPIKKIVIVSSGGTVYGRAVDLPISEDHPTDPISPYGITKLAVEKYARMYHALKGLPVVCVRPANAFGEGQKPFIGQGFVATAIASALEGREINIFGEQGTIRDLVYVKDVAAGIAAALNHCPPGECYNIGSGIGRNNLEILEMLAAIAKSRDIVLRVKVLPSRLYDVPANVLDSSKLQNKTGWFPKVSLMKGLELTWKYFEEHYNQ